MKVKEKQKKGISLIVLIITIIVMIVLAGAIIISLNNSGIIGKANKATEDTNMKVYEEAVHLEYINLQADESKLGDMTVEEYIREKLKEKGIDIPSYYKITDKGELLVFDDVNIPVVVEGMIPVKYEGGKWVKADETNKNNDWYKYDETERKWANVVTVTEGKREGYTKAKVGTEIAMSDIEGMFVWVPRYAYSIKEGYYRTSDEQTETASPAKVDIEFLVGTTNSNKLGKKYRTDYDASKVEVGEATPMIVHPAFNFGGKQVTGIWVAKFEASGNPGDPADYSTYPGNMPEDATTLPAVTESTYVKVLPNVPSWRSITIGEAQYQCMKMNDSGNKHGFRESEIDTHLMKNTEWGAVAYISASKYGKVPMINQKGSYASSPSHHYNLLTGYQGSTYTYETVRGQKASTTHNIYGIYDMNGGAWERPACYLNNNNSSLTTYGKSTSKENNVNIIYFSGNKLKSEYAKYWDVYEVSEEERNNKIEVSKGVYKTQSDILVANAETYAWNAARKRITDITFEKMASKKGDALYETAGSHSYYGVYSYKATENEEQVTKYSWTWLINASDTGTKYGRSWNSDYVLIGHASFPFVVRGGGYNRNINAGVFYSYIAYGGANIGYGFRPVCLPL